MKALAYALLVVGTIVASLGGAKLPSASVTISAIGLAILVVAIVLFRLADRKAPEARGDLADHDVRALLARLPERTGALASEAEALELGAIPARVDELFAELVTPIAEGSPKLLRELGADRFAEVFSAFASAERTLARAWSAAADGHGPEARACLVRAHERAERAARALAA